MKLPNPFKRTRQFIVYATKRGKRVLLGSIECSPNELSKRLTEFLTKKAEEIPDLASYKHIIIVDAKDWKELKITNPFYEQEEEEEASTRSSRGSIDTETIINMIKPVAKLQGELMKAVIEGLSDVMKTAIKESLSMGIEAVREVKRSLRESIEQEESEGEDLVEGLAKEFLKSIFRRPSTPPPQQQGDKNEPQAG